MGFKILPGDCRVVLKDIPDSSIDSVVSDPPSGIHMMSKSWDHFKPDSEDELAAERAELMAFQNFLVEVFIEVYRVLKPGAFGLVWALPRTSHHTGMALERSGFEIRDRFSHVFSQGYKKGLDIKKALLAEGLPKEAEDWTGHHTGIKPAVEDWWLIRKPISGRVLDNLLEFRTGALNIDSARIYTDWNEEDRPESWKNSGHTSKPEAAKVAAPPGQGIECHPLGRWPANLLLSHSKYDYYTLKADTSRETSEAIYLFYGAHEALRSLRESNSGDALVRTNKEVLQSEVLCRQPKSDQKEGVGKDYLPSMRKGVRGDSGLVQERKEEVLQQEVPWSSTPEKENGTSCGSDYKSHVGTSKREAPSGEVLPVEGWKVPGWSGLSSCDSKCVIKDCSESSGSNDHVKWVPTGTSLSNGPQTKQAIGEERSSSPLERYQKRQSTRKPFPIQSEGTQHFTPGIRARTYSTEKGKQVLEVISEAIPFGWLRYFEYSRTEGCRVVGFKTLKGDQRGNPGGKRPGGFFNTGSDSGSGKPNAQVYGNENLPIYECSPGCPVRILEGQESGASRFFKVFEPDFEDPFLYQAKPSTKEKNEGLDEGLVNEHPTVKSVKLMKYLVKLVTPSGGVVIDPFAGSGTTLVAALEEGFDCIGIENDPESIPVLQNRVGNVYEREEERRSQEEAFNMIFELESE